MKLSGNSLLLFVVAVLLMGSCFDPPTYSVVPNIELGDLYFKTGEVTDTIVLVVKFRDGDGDIGLAQSDTTGTYANKIYPAGVNGSKYLTYAARRKAAPNPYDTLPAYVRPFYCTRYQFKYVYVTNGVNRDPVGPISGGTTRVRDTVYFRSNPNYYNIFVDFYIQNGTTLQFEKFDFDTQFATSPANCGLASYNGRLPVLSKDLSRKTPLEGSVKYGMRSQAFSAILGSRAFKLRISIQDRALNKSNVIETPVNNLAGIRRN